MQEHACTWNMEKTKKGTGPLKKFMTQIEAAENIAEVKCPGY